MKTKFNYQNLGLLILRVGIGVAFFFHGLPKITGGIEKWTSIGETMSILGISFAPAFWGFMAAISETLGGLLLALGILFRPATLMMMFTMIVALVMHLHYGDSFVKYSHAMESLIVFAALFITGPGKYVVSKKLLKK